MTQQQRKLWGIGVILAVIAGWSIVAVWLYDLAFARFGLGVQFAYFALAGLGWFFPAALVIRWMSKPDKTVSR